VRSARLRPGLPKVRAVCVAPLRTRGCAPCAALRLSLRPRWKGTSALRLHLSSEAKTEYRYGYHHSTDDGKYLIMGNGTQAFAIAADQREQENYMRTAELSTEQNYNMIDGQINNTPSVDELEEKAKRGEVISLSALAAAVKAEDGRTPQRDPDGKKPSIRAQLKADRVQSGKPQQREKEQEAKRSIRQALEME